MHRDGATFEQMCAALRDDPETADWFREKGEANDRRELHRIWERTDPEDGDGRPRTFYNPWEDPPPPQWPKGVLSSETEETIALLSLRDGVDFGAQAMAYVAVGIRRRTEGCAPRAIPACRLVGTANSVGDAAC